MSKKEEKARLARQKIIDEMHNKRESQSRKKKDKPVVLLICFVFLKCDFWCLCVQLNFSVYRILLPKNKLKEATKMLKDST